MYKNIDIEFVKGKKATLTIFKRNGIQDTKQQRDQDEDKEQKVKNDDEVGEDISMDDGMEIIDTVTLSDYKTEQEMHDLLIKYGFVKMGQEEIQQMQKQWKEEEMEAERKKKELYKLRESQYAHERERKEEMKRKMRENSEDERKRIREMQMNDYITRRKVTQSSVSSSRKDEEYMVLLQDVKKINERARDAAKVKKHYHNTMNEAKRGNIVLDDEKRKQMEADFNEANLILDNKLHLENKLKQLKKDLYEENKRKMASAREDL